MLIKNKMEYLADIIPIGEFNTVNLHPLTKIIISLLIVLFWVIMIYFLDLFKPLNNTSDNKNNP